jgi:hypothetical protein
LKEAHVIKAWAFCSNLINILIRIGDQFPALEVYYGAQNKLEISLYLKDRNTIVAFVSDGCTGGNRGSGSMP